MEPLRSTDDFPERGHPLAKGLLAALILGLLGLPFLAMVARLIVAARFDDLSFTFVRILVSSVGFTLAQSALSALLSVVFGLALGTALALQSGRTGRMLSAVVDALGTFAFVLPGVVVALLVIQLNHFTGIIPAEGIVAVALAHLFLNGFFVAASVDRRARGWLATGGRELLEAAALFGARGPRLIASSLRSVLRDEARLWFPLVFLWSFGAFATPLVLGGSTRAVSPEVLLFQSLVNDPSSTRVLALVLVQFSVGLFWARRATRLSHERLEQASASVAGAGDVPAPLLRGLPVSVVTYVACALLGLPILGLVVAPLFVTAGTNASGWTTLWPSMSNTLTLAAFVVMLTSAFSLLLALAGSAMRRNVTLLAGVSSTLVAAAWMASGFDTVFQSNLFGQFAAAALGICLALLPFCALWIDRRLAALPTEHFEAARLLGARRLALVRYLMGPALRDVFAKILLIAFVGAIGELSITGLFILDAELAALHARVAAQRYDFSASSRLLAFILLLTALGVFADRKLRRKAQAT